MSGTGELLAKLQQELHCAQSLLTTLESEKRLLESRDLAGLQPLLSRKSELLTELEKHHQSRQRWLQAEGFPLTNDELLTQLADAPDSQAKAVVEQLNQHKSILNKCNYYNNLNGILVVNSKRRNARQLELMRGVSQEQKLYTPAGATVSKSSQNNVGQA